MTNAELKAVIQAAVYENAEGAITGTALQGILLKIVDQFETPVIDWDNITLGSGEGTAAEIAEMLGVSEDVVNRMADGLIPEIIFKKAEYRGTVFLSAPSNTTREYSGANGFGYSSFSVVHRRVQISTIHSFVADVFSTIDIPLPSKRISPRETPFYAQTQMRREYGRA